jgi:hypothetical protein
MPEAFFKLPQFRAADTRFDVVVDTVQSKIKAELATAGAGQEIIKTWLGAAGITYILGQHRLLAHHVARRNAAIWSRSGGKPMSRRYC